MFWPSIAVLSTLSFAWAAQAATRPHYGGTLRIEMHEAAETADPPQPGDLSPARRLAGLLGPFRIVRWEPGRRAVYAADETFPGGRPFLDAIEIELGRAPRDQLLDLEVGKADMVEASPGEARRPASELRVWSSAPIRLLALVAANTADPAARQALALAIDRSAIRNVLLQRQGEIASGILPQWLSGYAFVFATPRDLARARSIAAALPAPARALTLGYDPVAPQARSIADRVALNARDAGLAVQVSPQNPRADLRLATADMVSADPAVALAQAALALGVGEPPRAESPEALYHAERALLENARVIPLCHLPESWAVAPRVRSWRAPPVNRMGAWQLEDVWLEPAKP